MAMLNESITLEGTVRVGSRNGGWGLQTQSATLKYVDPIPGVGEPWGRYTADIENHPLPPILDGGGPWDGTYAIVAEPSIGPSAMHAHKDLRYDGKPYAIYPYQDQDSVAIRTCGVSGSLNVHQLNNACRRSTQLANFKAHVEAHEHYHQNSLNACIRSVNAGRFRALESVTGTYGEVEQELQNRWVNSIQPDLIQARKTAQGSVYADIWHWRANRRWMDGGPTVGHTGTNGCTG